MTCKMTIQPCNIEHIKRYGEIYASAFSGEPWNDPWKPEDASIHIRDLLESKTAYGLECIVDGQVAGFVVGTSMLFHYGRTFEINDLAVDPLYQRRVDGKDIVRYQKAGYGRRSSYNIKRRLSAVFLRKIRI